MQSQHDSSHIFRAALLASPPVAAFSRVPHAAGLVLDGFVAR